VLRALGVISVVCLVVERRNKMYGLISMNRQRLSQVGNGDGDEVLEVYVA